MSAPVDSDSMSACMGKEAMTREGAQRAQARRGFHIYRCAHCGAWHTSGARTRGRGRSRVGRRRGAA